MGPGGSRCVFQVTPTCFFDQKYFFARRVSTPIVISFCSLTLLPSVADVVTGWGRLYIVYDVMELRVFVFLHRADVIFVRSST